MKIGDKIKINHVQGEGVPSGLVTIITDINKGPGFTQVWVKGLGFCLIPEEGDDFEIVND